MVKRLMVAAVVVMLALAAFVPQAFADEPVQVSSGFTVATSTYPWLTRPPNEVEFNLGTRGGELIAFAGGIGNDGVQPVEEVLEIEAIWTSGAFQYVGWEFTGPGRWEWRQAGIDKFRLAYFPPPGGLQPGEGSGFRVYFRAKCGPVFGSIGGEGPDGYRRMFHFGISEPCTPRGFPYG